MGLLLALFVIYILPGIIASSRHHHQAGAIWALNILLGWTFLGWVVSFVWALTKVVDAAKNQAERLEAAYIASGRTPPPPPANLPDMSRWTLKDTQAYLAKNPQPAMQPTDLDRMHARVTGRPLKNV